MRILGISDVEEGWLYEWFNPARLEGVDLILSCGDLSATYLEGVVTLANLPLFYVRGNHDQSFDERAPEGCETAEGRILECCGLRILGLGGSYRYNSSVFGFTERQMARRARRLSRLAKATGGVDIIMTHAPVRGYGDLDDYAHRGFEVFDQMLWQLRPRYLIHGHVHLSYGRIPRIVEHPSGTTIVNACGSYAFDLPDELVPARRSGAGRLLLKLQRSR